MYMKDWVDAKKTRARAADTNRIFIIAKKAAALVELCSFFVQCSSRFSVSTRREARSNLQARRGGRDGRTGAREAGRKEGREVGRADFLAVSQSLVRRGQPPILASASV